MRDWIHKAVHTNGPRLRQDTRGRWLGPWCTPRRGARERWRALGE